MKLVAAFILISILLASSAQARVLTVDLGDYGHAKTLSGAIHQASPGDTIQIQSGRYGGAVIDRTIKIRGGEGVYIEGPLTINAPGCELCGLKINTSQEKPSLSLLSRDCRAVSCTISGAKVAVVSEGSNNTIAECSISSPGGIEIFAPDNRIQRCSIQGGVGVRINHTTGCLIEDCTINALQGVLVEDSNENSILNNTITTNGLGLVLTRSNGNGASGNNITGAYVSGVDVFNSRANNLEGNLIEGGKVGISLRGTEYCNVTLNNVLGNERAGIYGNGAMGSLLSGNTLAKNGNGILLSGSEDNIVQSNEASNNIYGISLRGSMKNLLRNNIMEMNRYNMRIDSGEGSIDTSHHQYYDQSIDESNLVDGRPVCYLVERSGVQAPEDCGFLGVVSCQDINAKNLRISNSSVGMLLVNSSGCHIENSSVYYAEDGLLLRESKDSIISGCRIWQCDVGFDCLDSSRIQFVNNQAQDCKNEGFRVDGSLNLLLLKCNSTSSNGGISLHGSRLCRVQDCRADGNAKDGLILSLSHKCSIVGNQASTNDRGIALAGSNACTLESNSAISNQRDGISLEQLSDAEVMNNTARDNGQGIFVQSSKRSRISGNILCNNSRYGLRMSTSTDCNITENEICSNQIAGINLVDCTDNSLYHNIIRDNLIQNAADNGQNRWDAGADIGGNYWSDHAVVGDPGSVPRSIPGSGLDRYPFQHPGGWS